MALIPTEQEIRAGYEKASPLVQTYIASAELQDEFNAIRTAHQLHFDEAGKMSDALVATFLGLREMKQFPELLREALEQNGDKHSEVLKDINEKIFSSFRRKLELKPLPQEEVRHSTPPASLLSVSKPHVTLEKRGNEEPKTFSVNMPPFEAKEKGKNATEKKDASYKSGIDPYRESVE